MGDFREVRPLGCRQLNSGRLAMGAAKAANRLRSLVSAKPRILAFFARHEVEQLACRVSLP
jgi:hypothetical protein